MMPSRPASRGASGLSFLIVLLIFCLTGCGTPDPNPKGTQANPYIWVLVPSLDPEVVQNGAEALTAYIQEEKGIVIVPRVAPDFISAVDLLCSGEADIGALNTFGYLIAHDLRHCAEVGLVSERFGSSFYSGQIVVNAFADIHSVADLEGTTFCRPDPNSTSGWIIPRIAMLAQGLDPDTDLSQVVDAAGHDGVIRQVYAGTCQAGATFIDARDNVEEDHPDVDERVQVILETTPIPNDNISFAAALSTDEQNRLKGAFLRLTETDLGLKLLVLPQNWEGLVVKEDDFYDGFRNLLQEAGVDIAELTP